MWLPTRKPKDAFTGKSAHKSEVRTYETFAVVAEHKDFRSRSREIRKFCFD